MTKHVLLIEDAPGEARLMQEAFKSSSPTTSLHWAKDAGEAMAFLKKQNPYQNMPDPDAILLDLNLPGKDGRELLTDIKGDETINHIPVLVLSNSTYSKDVAHCYKLHANCYLAKPASFNQMVHLVELIHKFWLNTVCAL